MIGGKRIKKNTRIFLPGYAGHRATASVLHVDAVSFQLYGPLGPPSLNAAIFGRWIRSTNAHAGEEDKLIPMNTNTLMPRVIFVEFKLSQQ